MNEEKQKDLLQKMTACKTREDKVTEDNIEQFIDERLLNSLKPTGNITVDLSLFALFLGSEFVRLKEREERCNVKGSREHMIVVGAKDENRLIGAAFLKMLKAYQ